MDTINNTGRPQAPTTHVWFRAKRYGWGWGLPVAWQGWMVLAIYAVGVLAMATLLGPSRHPGEFTAGLAVATLLLLAVCWLKGEPPRWRWGD